MAPQTSDETEEESMEVESAPEVETPQTSRNAAMANNIKSKLVSVSTSIIYLSHYKNINKIYIKTDF